MNHTGRSFAIFAIILLAVTLLLTRTDFGNQVLASLSAAVLKWRTDLAK